MQHGAMEGYRLHTSVSSPCTMVVLSTRCISILFRSSTIRFVAHLLRRN